MARPLASSALGSKCQHGGRSAMCWYARNELFEREAFLACCREQRGMSACGAREGGLVFLSG
jgi:hypothetical protein